MGNTLDDRGLADLKKMSDDELVKNAGTVDMAVLVEANIRLKNSNECFLRS